MFIPVTPFASSQFRLGARTSKSTSPRECLLVGLFSAMTNRTSRTLGGSHHSRSRDPDWTTIRRGQTVEMPPLGTSEDDILLQLFQPKPTTLLGDSRVIPTKTLGAIFLALPVRGPRPACGLLFVQLAAQQAPLLGPRRRPLLLCFEVSTGCADGPGCFEPSGPRAPHSWALVLGRGSRHDKAGSIEDRRVDGCLSKLGPLYGASLRLLTRLLAEPSADNKVSLGQNLVWVSRWSVATAWFRPTDGWNSEGRHSNRRGPLRAVRILPGGARHPQYPSCSASQRVLESSKTLHLFSCDRPHDAD